jgi:3-methylfumaryl-CoA hydratase
MQGTRVSSPASTGTEEMDDVCALPLVRRVAAMLDRDPARWQAGDPLPRGWHVALFSVATPQSELRPDGVAGLGVRLPDLGLPRIMMGGKRTRFEGDITIGEPVRRVSRITSVSPKEGRSGRFVIVTMQHEIFAGSGTRPVIVEEQDYVMREAAGESPATASQKAPARMRRASDVQRELLPDEALLFRYSAVTFNAHRIHYDHPYATGREGYPALVVNGGIPVIFLVELFRDRAGRQPAAITTRNLSPLYCGRPVQLCAIRSEPEWRLWAEDESGATTVEVAIA